MQKIWKLEDLGLRIIALLLWKEPSLTKTEKCNGIICHLYHWSVNKVQHLQCHKEALSVVDQTGNPFLRGVKGGTLVPITL